MSTDAPEYDLIIVGGGLAGILTAWRCIHAGTAERILIIERSADIGGDQVWSFNRTDMTPEALTWLSPAVAHEWRGYHVRFPAHERQLAIGYLSMNSDTLRAAVVPLRESGQLVVETNCAVAALGARSVTLASGAELHAGAVVDATGFTPSPHLILGYQKFVGQTVEMRQPHGLELPVIMDATVTQKDGYRFVYCLPWSPTSMLIEDTYYEDGPGLDDAAVKERIGRYAEARGWEIARVTRSERGILPITLASDLNGLLAEQANAAGAPKIGLAGGFFHAVTGYSVPDAVRVASVIADLEKISADSVAAAITRYRQDHWEREKFFRLLNRMLFRAGKPQERYRILQRFYRLDEALIASFYRGRLSLGQKARILAGKPPVPLGPAIYNLSEFAFFNRNRSSS